MDEREEILDLVDDLIDSGTPIIVEGREDKKALQELGVENILTLSMPLFKIVEKISGKEVAILTDLDKKGKQLYRKIQHDCIHHGICINNKLRHFLFRETQLSHIEGLDTYLRNLEKKEILCRNIVNARPRMGNKRENGISHGMRNTIASTTHIPVLT